MAKSRTFRLDKLVRDGIVSGTIAGGGEVVRRDLRTPEERKGALIEKLIEEAKELLGADAVTTGSEIADLQEVVDQLAHDAGLSKGEIAALQKQKRDRVGGFENGDFIETVTLLEGNPWIAYYAADPEKYPEVET